MKTFTILEIESKIEKACDFDTARIESGDSRVEVLRKIFAHKRWLEDRLNEQLNAIDNIIREYFSGEEYDEACDES